MPTLRDQFHVTVSSDDQESIETDTMLLTIQARIQKSYAFDDLNAALLDLGRRIVASGDTPA